MSVEIKEKSKTPKFKKGQSVIIAGEGHGVVLDSLSPTLYKSPTIYRIKFPNGHTFIRTEDKLAIDNGIVDDIMIIFENMHLTPISDKDRKYAQGFIDGIFEYDNMLPEQRDELYKKMGIE